jgi:hypothetical protein
VEFVGEMSLRLLEVVLLFVCVVLWLRSCRFVACLVVLQGIGVEKLLGANLWSRVEEDLGWLTAPFRMFCMSMSYA